MACKFAWSELKPVKKGRTDVFHTGGSSKLVEVNNCKSVMLQSDMPLKVAKIDMAGSMVLASRTFSRVGTAEY
jgi:hypothetical protein